MSLTHKIFFAFLGCIVIAAIILFLSSVFVVEYTAGASETHEDQEHVTTDEKPQVATATHVATPEPLKAVYMTSWVAGTPSLRGDIVDLIDTTELNAVVVDIKDSTGHISYEVADPKLHEIGSWEDRIPDLRDFIARLHAKNIYVIGRISVFQDPFYTKIHPELAVKRESDGGVWNDYKGLSFIDVGAKEYWKYIVLIAEDAHNAGFDEINFDYVRFPSDGNMKDIYFPFSNDRITADPSFGRADVLEDFFAYLYDALADSGVVLSVDLFGYTTTNHDDLGIGQLLERALPYFNYIMPMVYPSHYNNGFIGYEHPAVHPYEVVEYSMKSAVQRAKKLQLAAGSTSTSTEVVRLRAQAEKGHGDISPGQLRPWLQDFDLGATYTADMVRTQIQATYDTGLTSWSLWDAGNTYTKGALLEDSQEN